MLLVTQIDTFYKGLTLSHRDTINAAAGGTYMQKTPKECYKLIENMTAHHNHWDTSAIQDETSRNISSTSTTESLEVVRQLDMMNKNFLEMMRQFQTVKIVDTKCKTCGGPYSFTECPAVDPESLIRRRNLGKPSSLFDFEEVMNNNHNQEPPPQNNNGPPPMVRPNGQAPRMMEELCQPSINGWGGPIAPIPIQATEFGLRHHMIQQDTINAVAGGTFMQKTPKECYELIENMTVHHNHWDTSAIQDEISRNISSTSTTESLEVVRQLDMMNKNLLEMMRKFQTVKIVDTKCSSGLRRSPATPCLSIHAIYVMYCLYIHSLSVMLSRISFHVLYGRPFKTLCFFNYALMIRQDYDITSSLRRGALQFWYQIQLWRMNMDQMLVNIHLMTLIYEGRPLWGRRKVQNLEEMVRQLQEDNAQMRARSEIEIQVQVQRQVESQLQEHM
nr:reverse transcriptase domain-containing protein [Tanacetum cinerariifolium]